MKSIPLVALSMLALVAQPSCKRQESPDRPSAAQQEDEKARVLRGDTVGEDLRRPSLAVEVGDILVNGAVVAKRTSGASGAAPSDALIAYLDALRKHWIAIHPGRIFDGEVALATATARAERPKERCR